MASINNKKPSRAEISSNSTVCYIYCLYGGHAHGRVSISMPNDRGLTNYIHKSINASSDVSLKKNFFSFPVRCIGHAQRLILSWFFDTRVADRMHLVCLTECLRLSSKIRGMGLKQRLPALGISVRTTGISVTWHVGLYDNRHEIAKIVLPACHFAAGHAY